MKSSLNRLDYDLAWLDRLYLWKIVTFVSAIFFVCVNNEEGKEWLSRRILKYDIEILSNQIDILIQ